MKHLIKYATLLSSGGLIYMLLEILFSGNTHWSMGILGGICFIIIGFIDSCYDIPIYKKMLLGSIIITFLEFTFGTIFNIILNFNIWNYSNMPLNILGQVCLPFSVLWFFLCYPAILLNRWIKWFFWNEKKEYSKPH